MGRYAVERCHATLAPPHFLPFSVKFLYTHCKETLHYFYVLVFVNH